MMVDDQQLHSELNHHQRLQNLKKIKRAITVLEKVASVLNAVNEHEPANQHLAPGKRNQLASIDRTVKEVMEILAKFSES
jgi:hypothetical protein